jgi:hypothetical protein
VNDNSLTSRLVFLELLIMQEQRQQSPCKFWPTGRCIHGDKCKFSHAKATNAGGGQQQQRRREELRPVQPHLEGGSMVDMFTDNYPPSRAVFNMEDWIRVRNQLREKGKASAKGSSGYYLNRVSMAMNLGQEFYGSALSVIGHQCGRLLCERVVAALIGPPADERNVLAARLKELKLNLPGEIEFINDLHKLREFGNRVDHEELDDLRPDEKGEVVECAYRVARALLLLKP